MFDLCGVLIVSSNQEKASLDRPFQLPKFDFNEWKSLSEQDPAAFEKKRQDWNKRFIESAPIQYQRRLKGLIFQIDVTRERAKNPMQSCLEISKMMWRSTVDLKCFIEDLADLLQNPDASKDRKQTTATIINFNQFN